MKEYCPYCEEEQEINLKKVCYATGNSQCEISMFECEKCKGLFENGELLDNNLALIRETKKQNKEKK